MKRINVSVASLNQTPGDFKGNIKNIMDAVKEAQKENSNILVTPELSITGYGIEDYFTYTSFVEKALIETNKLAETIPEDMIVIVGLPYMHNSYLYNGAALLYGGKIIGINFKKNLAANGIHYEQRWFTHWKENKSLKILDPKLGYEMNIGINIYDFHNFKIGIEICEDAWVSNRVASYYFENGVDIIANPSASHFAISKFKTRKTLVADSSRVYGVTYLYSNINGCESGRAIYDGGSLIANEGQIVNQGDRFHGTDYHVITTTINNINSKHNKISSSQRYTDPYSNVKAIKIEEDFKMSDILSPAKKNKVRDWELNSFVENEEAVRAIAMGIRDWARKTKVHGYSLSLSGGADSALVATLVYLSLYFDAEYFFSKGLNISDSYLGHFGDIDEDLNIDSILKKIMPKYLITAYQPSSNSGNVTKIAADKVASMLSSEHKVFVVGDIVDLYEKKIEEGFNLKTNWEEHDIFKQNMQARVRSPMIWGASNLCNRLLLTTSNLSEASVGYFTQDGDSSGVLAPICGVTKSRVLSLLKWLENSGVQCERYVKKFGYLSYINNQRPTAELRPQDQTQEDEDDLMPFVILDEIIRLHIQLNYTPIQVFEELSFNSDGTYDTSFYASCVVKYFTLFARNQWKRERQAPGFHIEMNSLDPKTYKRIPLLANMFEDELNEIKEFIE